MILSFSELQSVIEDSRYESWREVLKAVQGIYLIADTKTGHGGNVALRNLDDLDMSHRNQFQFSILRVFSPGASTVEIDAAEAH